MLLEMFFNFDGDCKEAVEFYAKVFKSSVNNLMTYGGVPSEGDVPAEEGYYAPGIDKGRVMYAGIPFDNMVLMCMDVPSGYEFAKGNNVSPTISFADKAEVTRVFNELKEGGIVHAEPTQTFFSELYCSVEDKFGILWQILYYVPGA